MAELRAAIPIMVYTPLTDDSKLSGERGQMLSLYKSLWGKGHEQVRRTGVYEIPCIPEERDGGFDGMLLEGTQVTFDYFQIPAGNAGLPNIWPKGFSARQESLLIRPCFDEIYHHIDDRGGRSTCILGGFGTGKSCLLLYMLVRKLIASEPVSYQVDPNVVYVFDKFGAFVYTYVAGELEPIVRDPDRWHLIDSEELTTGVPMIYTRLSRIVFTTSPEPERYAKWCMQTGTLHLWMGTFSWEEIYVVANHFVPPGRITDLNDLPRIFSLYGPVARVCIDLAGDQMREEDWLNRITPTVDRLQAGNRAWLPPASEVEASYSVFGIQKSPTRNVPNPVPLSRFISSLIIQQAQAVDILKAKGMLDTLLSSTITRQAGGMFFERFVHARLRHGTRLPVVGRQRRTTMVIDPTQSSSHPQFQTFRTLQGLWEEIKTSEGQVLQLNPCQPSYPFINSVMRRGKTIWLFQVALSKPYGIGVTDLNDLLGDIPLEYRPMPNRKVKLVIITLNETAPQEPYSLDTTRKAWWEESLETYVAAIDRNWLCMQISEKEPLRSRVWRGLIEKVIGAFTIIHPRNLVKTKSRPFRPNNSEERTGSPQPEANIELVRYY